MPIVKCRMCGRDVALPRDRSWGKCAFCGGEMTFPNTSDPARLERFDRAGELRRQNAFDRAINAYDALLDEDEDDAEAHWGALLSWYGIEFVKDPATGAWVPTCHRAQLGSILTDPDYQAALDNAPDAEARALYEREAQKIAELQKGILAISEREPPCDVFICYREQDERGERTVDSILAQDIYYQLTGQGYRVFYARISLEDKLGREYEPYVFAALRSARVMLVVGTKPERFNATWVRNEWSRFLSIMKNDRSRLLIPCYRDMDPCDLPRELSALQCQDMGRLGFMQDVLHAARKVLNAGRPATDARPAGGTVPSVEPLLTRARLFLEDGDWDLADEYAERVLDLDPKRAAAYIVKVQAARRVSAEAELANCKAPLTGDKNFEKALRFADAGHRERYEGYRRAIDERLRRAREAAEREERERREARQRREQERKERERRETERRAIEEWERWERERQEAEQREHEEWERLERERREAEQRQRLERERREAERRQREEQERRRAEERERLERELLEREAKRRRWALIAAVALVVAVAVAAGLLGAKNARLDRVYESAVSARNAGNKSEALALFTSLGNYRDAVLWSSSLREEIIEELAQRRDELAAYSGRLAAGGDHTVGLRSDGTVLAVGRDLYLECEVSDWTDITAVAAGNSHTVGLRSDGTVLGAGDNDYGQHSVEDWTDIMAVSATKNRTVGLRSDGTVLGVGSDFYGQYEVENWTDIVAVGAGDYHTVGLMPDGTVVAAGGNVEGQCSVWDWTDIVAVSANFYNTVGLKSDGTVLAVGDDQYGQCDVEDWTDIVAVAAGRKYTVGLKSDGTVVAVGNNEYGQCDVGDWTDIVAVAAGKYHTVGLRADGTVVATGNNEYHQCDVAGWELLGDGDASDSPSTGASE